ncbi:alpha/beta hydrolase [Leptospira noumeaensis]|uniref:Alpha/beta hydrolase n=1 Tax=Leptospira noumeaensis TaxID=2484964 RepID=A0A4R9I9L4_9LEPT|nr:alpha/beta hydrolase [Leptospira noumeaensis]TGK82467.1 alpha/beta hydrolase [Leptospira noumeaensis]
MLGIKKSVAKLVFSLPEHWISTLVRKSNQPETNQLDPHCALACNIAKFLPKMEQMSPEKARRHYRDQMRIFDEPEFPIPHIEDKLIPTPSASFIPIRVYNANPQKRNLPTILFFHGGGLTIGNLETHDNFCRKMSHYTKSIVIAVDYRLAPEHPYPAAHDDVWLAYQYVRNSAYLFGGSPNAIAVCGDSAGALLATSLCLRAKKDKVPVPIYQALLYPMLDTSKESETYELFGEKYVLTRSIMRWFIQNYLPNQKDRLIHTNSPVLADPKELKGLPPTYLGIAGYDPLREEGETYAKHLQSAGVKVEERHFPSLIHGYIQLTGLIPKAKEAEQDLFQALNRFFSTRKI